MLYTLPEAFLGTTTIEFYEILNTPGLAIRCTGYYGHMVDDEFVRESALTYVERTIQGRECAAFLDATTAEGAPRNDFRESDLTDWFTLWGHSGTGAAWYTDNPEGGDAG